MARNLMADCGYDSDHIREDVEQRVGAPIIPARKSRKNPEPIADFPHALQNLAERCINKLKNARRVATRYDKTAASYLGFIELVSVRIWFRHLSTLPKYS